MVEYILSLASYVHTLSYNNKLKIRKLCITADITNKPFCSGNHICKPCLDVANLIKHKCHISKRKTDYICIPQGNIHDLFIYSVQLHCPPPRIKQKGGVKRCYVTRVLTTLCIYSTQVFISMYTSIHYCVFYRSIHYYKQFFFNLCKVYCWFAAKTVSFQPDTPLFTSSVRSAVESQSTIV